MEEKHIETLEIPSYLVDGNTNLRPSSFLYLAQEMAQNAADVIGFGYEPMAAHNLAWVVSRIHLEFAEPIKWRDEIEFSTWHKGIERVFFRREYKVVDKKTGAPRVAGTSSWLAFDTVERRLFRTDRLGLYFNVNSQCDDSAVPQSAGKIVIPAGLETELAATHTVKYSDVDFIGHANNTSYVSWAMDCVPDDLVLAKYPKELDINFNMETRLGSTVELYRTIEITPDATVVYIEGKVEGNSHFVASIKY